MGHVKHKLLQVMQTVASTAHGQDLSLLNNIYWAFIDQLGGGIRHQETTD